jgi:cell division protein FtsB
VLTDSEAAVTALKAENEELQKTVKKLNHEIKLLNATAVEAKKLAELAATARRIALEEQYTKEFDELKSRTDAEKRRIYTVGVEGFRRFFNPMEEVNERSFKKVIEKAKGELDQLTESDSRIRRLVGALSNQTTEDAVAKLLL